MFTNVRMHGMENFKINTPPVFTFTHIYTFRNVHAGGIARTVSVSVNPLNAELHPICHLLALLGAHHILHVSRIRVTLESKTLAEAK
jgi:hypothetical protein